MQLALMYFYITVINKFVCKNIFFKLEIHFHVVSIKQRFIINTSYKI